MTLSCHSHIFNIYEIYELFVLRVVNYSLVVQGGQEFLKYLPACLCLQEIFRDFMKDFHVKKDNQEIFTL